MRTSNLRNRHRWIAALCAGMSMVTGCRSIPVGPSVPQRQVDDDFVPLDAPTGAYLPGTVVRYNEAGQRFIAFRCPSVTVDTVKNPVNTITGRTETNTPLTLVASNAIADTLFGALANRTISYRRQLGGGQRAITTDETVRTCTSRLVADGRPETGTYYLVREVILADSVSFVFADTGVGQAFVRGMVRGVGARAGSTYRWAASNTLVEHFDHPLAVYYKAERIWERKPSHASYVGRSLVLPGYGQFAKHEGAKGTGILLGVAGFGLLAYASDRFRADRLSVAATAGSQVDAARWTSEANQALQLRNGAIGGAAIVWAYGVYDAFTGPVRLVASRSHGELILRLPIP